MALSYKHASLSAAVLTALVAACGGNSFLVADGGSTPDTGSAHDTGAKDAAQDVTTAKDGPTATKEAAAPDALGTPDAVGTPDVKLPPPEASVPDATPPETDAAKDAPKALDAGEDAGKPEDASEHDASEHDASTHDASEHDSSTQDSSAHDSSTHDSSTHDSSTHDSAVEAGPTCPATEPTGTCTVNDEVCSYTGAACICTFGAPPTNMLHWSCSTLATGCPATAPAVGTTCSHANLVCDYGACMGGTQVECTGGKWVTDVPVCPG